MTIGQQDPAAPRLPPAGSPALVRTIELAFPTQGNVSFVEPQTYLYYIHTRPSRPSQGAWEPYDRQSVLDDFRRLWGTGFLDDLSVVVNDVPYENGVVGKHIVFRLEERARVKIVDYAGTRVFDADAIDKRLAESSIRIRPDSFVDPRIIQRTEGIVRQMLREKGFLSATVTHSLEPLSGGDPLRTVRLTFTIAEGPRVRVRAVHFEGNRALSDRRLRRHVKANKARPWWLPSLFAGDRSYKEAEFAEDADRVVGAYRDRGYIDVQVGDPELRETGTADAGTTSWVHLRVPVSEGTRYRVGTVSVEGNTVLKEEAANALFSLGAGRYYSEKKVRKAFEKAREVYGAAGYFEFTGYPDLAPRADGATVDVTIRLQEGAQYFVKRINFTGNSTTRDDVVRRELTLVEGGVFNTESLKYSIRRLNQLGYFKPLEDDGIRVEKAKDAEHKVDVTLKLEEQNRNQVTFGAGISGYEGLFGNFSYSAANFLGRGESLTLAFQKGSRSTFYQVALTEPYLLNRPISAAIDLYSRKYDYYTTVDSVAYSEVREGSTISVGAPVRRFSRAYLNYTYEVIDVGISADLEDLLEDSATTTGKAVDSTGAGIPFFNYTLDAGRHVDSRFSPTFIHNTVDNPIMPHSGKRLTASVQVAGEYLGGSYNYLKPELEAVLFLPAGRRTGFGFRADGGWLRAYGSTGALPYYLRYYLGGEYQIRGVDIRTVGPVDAGNRALGGNKFILFNAEAYFDIVPQVRALLFHDAGQAFAENEDVDLGRLRTSSGLELRFFMPVLNVPFRLIGARNLYRDVFQPAWAFKFAVGTTF